jgi:hypothetical protein
MAQNIFSITPVLVASPTASWTNVDVSAHIPVGATGILFHVYNPNTAWTRTLGVRKNGSTDNRDSSLSNNTHAWGAVGVDANRVFQVKGQWGIGTWSLYLIGYTTAGVTFFTNAYDKSLGSTGSWIDINCSVQAPGAIGLIIEINHDNTLYDVGLRKKGSTDARTNPEYGKNLEMAILGCDVNQTVQGYISSLFLDFFLIGYITGGATFNTNAVDTSLTSTGSWVALPNSPGGKAIVFYEVVSAGGPFYFGLRPKGSAENIYYYCYYHTWAYSPAYKGNDVEGKIENLAVDFFVIGGEDLVVDTYAATNIQGLQATGNGFILDVTNKDEIGFEWGVASGVYTDDITITDPFFAGDFSLTLSPLLPSTPYFYRAKAHDTILGWVYGPEKSFTTLPPLPQVLTSPPSSVTGVSFDANGNITSTGGDPTCDKRGFVYGLTSQPDPGNVGPAASGYDAYQEAAGSFGAGTFTINIPGLSQSKIYYIRAYAHNSFGYSYGPEVIVLTNTNVNILYPSSDYSRGIRFDSSPGGAYPNPYGGTIDHYILCLVQDSSFVSGGTWGSVVGNYVYERNYYNDNFYTDLFTMTNPDRQEEFIVKIKWKAHVLQNSYPYGQYKRVLFTHGLQYDGAPAACGIGAGLVCEIFYTNPNTGLGWTLAEANDLIAGVSLGQEGGWGVAACDLVLVYVLWKNAAVSADSTTNLGGTIRRLYGTVQEDEAETCQVHFEWGATAAYGNVTANQTKAKGDTFTADVDIGALPSIHFRAVIVTACGETFYSTDAMFPTAPLPAQANIPHRLVDGGFI